MISVILVDDHAIIREGLKAILASDEQITVCGEASSQQELANVLCACEADIMLLDLSMEDDESGFQVLSMVNEQYPNIAVIIISVFSQPCIVRRALTLGAKGYVAKHEATSHVLHAVQTVATGAIYMTPATITALITSENDQREPRKAESQELTRRENEILNLIGSWYSTKEIADMLNISHSTVGTHIENIKDKLNIPSKLELVQLAIARTHS